MKFRDTLTPEQLKTYERAYQDRREIKNRFDALAARHPVAAARTE